MPSRVAHPAVDSEPTRLGTLGLLATCVTVDLEVGYSARDSAGYAATARGPAAAFTDLPLRPEIGDRARMIQGARRLSEANTAPPASSTS